MRYRATQIGIRYVGKTTIIFYSPTQIYVKEGINCVLYHNFYSPKGSYTKSFGQFSRALKRNTRMNFSRAACLANHYEVKCMGATMPNVEGKTMRVFPEGGRREIRMNKNYGSDKSELIMLGCQFKDRVASVRPRQKISVAISKKGESQEIRVFVGKRPDNLNKEDYEFIDEN